MPDLTLAARPRTVVGKKVARLRRAGVTPANIYGHNVPSTAIEVDTHDTNLLVRRAGRTSLITLTLDGEVQPRRVLVRDVQRLPTTGELLHVDFMQVSMREKLRVSVPLVLTGHAPVLDTADAVTFQNLETVEVECLPADIPQHIDVDVSGMTDTTATVHIRDLAVPPGVTVLTDPDVSVVSVTLQTAEEEVVEEEAPEAAEVPTVGEEEAAEAEEE